MSTNDLQKIINQGSNTKKRFFYIFLLIILLVGVGFYFYNSSSFVKDLIGNPFSDTETSSNNQEFIVTNGSLADTLTSSGSAESNVSMELFFSTSGEVIEAYVDVGSKVSKGEKLIRLDDTDALRSVENAELKLLQANLNMEKLISDPTDAEIVSANQSIASAETQLINAKLTLSKLEEPNKSDISSAESSVVKARLTLDKIKKDSVSSESEMSSAKATVSQAELTLDQITNPSQSDISSAEYSVTQSEASFNSTTKKIDTFYASLLDAQNNFCEDIEDDKPPVCNTSNIPLSELLITRLLNEIKRENDPSTIRVSRTKTFIDANSSYQNSLKDKDVAESNLQSAKAKLDNLLNPRQSKIDQAQASLDSAKLKLKALENSYETDLEDAQLSLEVATEKRDLLLNPKERDLNQAKSSIASAEASLLSAQAKLNDLIEGVSVTDRRIQEQNVKLAELALAEAVDKLNDYNLVSPIDGIVGQMNVDVGDKVNSSTSVMMISDPNSVRIDLTVSETDLIGLNEDMYGIALFDSLPDQFYVISISNVSQIPKVTQGIVTYPVESEILTGQKLMQALPELMRLASGLSMTGDLGNFSSMMPGGGMGGPPGGGMGGPPGSAGRGMPDIDIECAQKAIGEIDLDFSDFRSLGRENIEKLRNSGCISRPSAPPPGGGMQAMMETLLNPSLPPAGMTANVILLKGIKENLLLVPSKAISRRGRDAFVNKKVSDTEIQEIKVTLGESDGTRTQIISGVQEGETIILRVNNSSGTQQESSQTNSPPPSGPPRGGMGGRGGLGPR